MEAVKHTGVFGLQGIPLLSLGSLSVYPPFIYFMLLFYETWIWKEIESMLFPTIPFTQYTYTFACYCLFCVFYIHSIPKFFTVTICNIVSWQQQNCYFSRIFKIIFYIYQQFYRILGVALFCVILIFLAETSVQFYGFYNVDLEPYRHENWVSTYLQTDIFDPFLPKYTVRWKPQNPWSGWMLNSRKFEILIPKYISNKLSLCYAHICWIIKVIRSWTELGNIKK